jgi:hypothetical protein
MAPEVIEDGQASARSDVYSLGVLLYHLVTGEYPVNARSIEELRDAHANRKHRWLSEVRPDLPVAFMQVVEKGIALDPEDRFANASELLAALSELEIAARPWLWRLVKPLIALSVVVVGMLALGSLTSSVFNNALQRADFTNETLANHLLWGRRTSFPPFLILLFALLVFVMLSVVRRLVVAASATARRWDAKIRGRAGQVAHRFRLDEASLLASCTLLTSAAITSAAMFYYSTLTITAITVATAPYQDLALLAPTNVAYHNQYRWIFTLVVVFSVVVWYPVSRLVRRGQSVHWGLIGAGAVVTCVAIALLHAPYRMLYFNNGFEAVTWNDRRCFNVGERSSQLLLFCPEQTPPRTRIVSKDDPALQPLGIRQSLFADLNR